MIISTRPYLGREAFNDWGWRISLIMFVIAVFVMPETRQHSIWEEGAIEATRA